VFKCYLCDWIILFIMEIAKLVKEVFTVKHIYLNSKIEIPKTSTKNFSIISKKCQNSWGESKRWAVKWKIICPHRGQDKLDQQVKWLWTQGCRSNLLCFSESHPLNGRLWRGSLRNHLEGRSQLSCFMSKH